MIQMITRIKSKKKKMTIMLRALPCLCNQNRVKKKSQVKLRGHLEEMNNRNRAKMDNSVKPASNIKIRLKLMLPLQCSAISVTRNF